MKKDEARREVIRAFDKWWKDRDHEQGDKGTGNDAMVFFGQLRQSNPQLFDFKASGDKWQVVHGWLLSADRVSD